jgi:hypothetical protein
MSSYQQLLFVSLDEFSHFEHHMLTFVLLYLDHKVSTEIITAWDIHM